MTDNDCALAAKEAQALAADFWERRWAFETETLSVREAVARGRRIEGGPVLLVDTADCTGGGAPGDSVALLRELLAMGVEEPAFLMVVDATAAQRCANAGIGRMVSLQVGYSVDPTWGQPVAVSGVVGRLSDGDFVYDGGLFGGTRASMGLSAVVQIGSVELLIMSQPTYDWGDEQFRSVGMDVRRAKFVGVKNPMNYRRAYRDVMKAAFVVDTPGPTPAHVRNLRYRRMKRPFFPFDEEIPGLEIPVVMG
ncbi:MAG: MlrC C-terminal domain-containing protein [Caldilineaceae bacterium]|nr:MlrC C-terminal domain-containing protein [Caldilineaceae bacterium]